MFFSQVQQSSTVAISQMKGRQARHGGQLFNRLTNDKPQVRKAKKGPLFHFTEANCLSEVPHFRIEFADPTSYVERYSPKGSCHHVESSMSDTLAQTCLSACEVGMHITYENSTSKPGRRKGCIPDWNWRPLKEIVKIIQINQIAANVHRGKLLEQFIKNCVDIFIACVLMQ